jgi:hypothetical protein
MVSTSLSGDQLEHMVIGCNRLLIGTSVFRDGNILID